MFNSYEVCIIGAGISGSFLTMLLSQNNKYNITVIEMGRGVGGRMAVHRFTNLGNTTNFNIGHSYMQIADPKILKHLNRFNVIHIEQEKYFQESNTTTKEHLIVPQGDVSNDIIKKMLFKNRKVNILHNLLCNYMAPQQITTYFNTLVTSIRHANNRYEVITNTNKTLMFDIVINTSPINCNKYYTQFFKSSSPFHYISSMNHEVETTLSELRQRMSPVSNDKYTIFFQGIYLLRYLQYNVYCLLDQSKLNNNEYLLKNPIEEIRVNKVKECIVCSINSIFSQKYNLVNKESMEYRYNNDLEDFNKDSIMYKIIWTQLINFLKKKDFKKSLGNYKIDKFVEIYVMQDYYQKWSNAYNIIKDDYYSKEQTQNNYIKLHNLEIYLVGDYINNTCKDDLLESALQSCLSLADKLNGLNFKYDYTKIECCE